MINPEAPNDYCIAKSAIYTTNSFLPEWRNLEVISPMLIFQLSGKPKFNKECMRPSSKLSRVDLPRV